MNQPNIHRYSVEPQKIDSAENVELLSAHLCTSSDLYGQHVTAEGLAEFQGFGSSLGPIHSTTSQSYSLFPSLSMGNSSVTSLPSYYKKDYIKNHHPDPSASSPMTIKIPSYSAASSQVNFQLKTANSGGPQSPLLENAAVTQSSRKSGVSQRVGFLTGLPTPWPDIIARQDASSPRTNKFSSSLFQSPGSASRSLETSSGTPYEQPSQNCFKPENNVGCHEQRSEKASFVHENSTKVHNPTPLIRNNKQQSSGKHYSEVDSVASASLLTHSSQQPSDEEGQKDVTPVAPACDVSDSGHSLHRKYSLLHQLHYPRDAQTDCGRRFPFKHQNIEYPQAMTKAKQLFSSGQKYEVKDKAKINQEPVQAGAFSLGDDQVWKFLQVAQEVQSGKASSAAYLQNSQRMKMLDLKDSQNHFIGSNEASIAACQSQISLQMAPALSKHCETFNNDNVLPIYNSKAAITAAQSFSGLGIGNLKENSLIMKANSTNTSHGSGIWPSSSATLIMNKHSSPSSLLASDVTYQNLAASKLKKRKIVAFDMVPWHNEVNCEALRTRNISLAELERAQTSNRRQEQVTSEAEIVDDVLPVVRAKRRLIFTTQLTQQVFRPATVDILFADASSSNCEYLAYSATRLALGDACNLNAKLPSNSNDFSSDKLKTSKRTSACDFSKVVDCLISRVNKLEGDLSRLGQNFSVADIKVESQELEKFSTLNHLAKSHIKAHPSTVDPASSTGPSSAQKTTPQRYVKAVPVPRILPEWIDCLPL